MGACFSPVDGWPEPGEDPLGPVNAEGVLSDVVLGLPATGPCSADDYRGWVGSPDGADTSSARFTASDGTEYALAAAVPEGDLAPLAGPVTVDFGLQFRGFAPTVGHLMVSGADGWGLWVAEAGEVDALWTPAEAAVARGPLLERETDDCGAWDEYATEVTIAGQSALVELGATDAIGEARVTVGAHAVTVPGSYQCLDWFADAMRLGAWR